MNWHYRCPSCGAWGYIDWEKRENIFKCHKYKVGYTPPSPYEDHDAYIDAHDWPLEMEEVVIALKGKYCTVPWCKKKYETLDHRVAYSKDGRTSVVNLFPMCNEHNQSKGDSNYDNWLRKQLAEEIIKNKRKS